MRTAFSDLSLSEEQARVRLLKHARSNNSYKSRLARQKLRELMERSDRRRDSHLDSDVMMPDDRAATLRDALRRAEERAPRLASGKFAELRRRGGSMRGVKREN